jgi:alanyl-tRNA synthetase
VAEEAEAVVEAAAVEESAQRAIAVPVPGIKARVVAEAVVEAAVAAVGGPGGGKPSVNGCANFKKKSS